MRLAFPSISLAVTIGTQTTLLQSLFGLTQALRGNAATKQGGILDTELAKSQEDTSNMSDEALQEHISRLIKKKANAKFDLRDKIAGRVSSLSTNEECTPFHARRQTDIGILASCFNPEDVCVTDTSSSFGGRCVGSSDVTQVMDERIEQERHLMVTQQCTYSNGTTGGVKCKGWHACWGLDEQFISNNIGCGSCNGYGSCWGISGKFKSSVQDV
jgi:hypothetical protein